MNYPAASCGESDPEQLKHLAAMNVRPDRGPFIGRAKQQIAFISDPDGNSIELMQIPPESPLYRDCGQ